MKTTAHLCAYLLPSCTSGGALKMRNGRRSRTDYRQNEGTDKKKAPKV